MKTCLFCSAPLTRHNRSREPVIPSWLVSHLEAQDKGFIGRHWSYPNEPTIIFSEKEQDFLSLVLGDVCKACNTGWMAKLEADIRPILEALSDGRSPTVLSCEQCDTLARWTFKTASALNYSVNYKKIVPLEHIQQFFNTGRLPENATVDLALCYKVGLHWILGGNKKFAVRSIRIKESQKKATYVITLQFGHLLLRLAWVPVDGLKAAAVPASAVHHIFPQDNAVQVVRGRIFSDLDQFHFMATILAEEGIYPEDLDLEPLTEQSPICNPRYVVWNGSTLTDYHWDGIHDCAVCSDMRLISVQKVRQYFLSHGIEPIILFTCQRGQPALEVNTVDQGWRGLGSYCFLKVLAKNPAICIRDLITCMNDLIAEMGFDQVSEVICKEDLLDHQFFEKDNSYNKCIFIGFYDICRTPTEPGDYIIDHDELSP